MKHLAYTIVLLLALAVLASAKTCPYNEGDSTAAYTKCALIKPVEAFTGDEITINCTKIVKVNNAWVYTPMKGTPVFIKGYNKKGELQQNMTTYIGADGTKTFTPLIAGEYVIEAMGLQQKGSEVEPVKVPWVATFTVEENPVTNRGIIRAQPEETPEDVPEEIEQPTGAAIAIAPDPPVDPTATVELLTGPQVCKHEPFTFVLNGTDDSENKQEASNFVLMLVGLLIS